MKSELPLREKGEIFHKKNAPLEGVFWLTVQSGSELGYAEGRFLHRLWFRRYFEFPFVPNLYHFTPFNAEKLKSKQNGTPFPMPHPCVTC